MKKIYFSSLNHLLSLDRSIIRIKIENQSIYRNICFNIMSDIVYSEEDKVVNIEKNSLLIYNPFQININETKIIKGLYKKAEGIINHKFLDKMSRIKTQLFEMIDYIALDLDNCIEYNEDIDLQKMLSSIGMCYRTIDYNNYLELLLEYIKINYELFNIKVVFSIGLTNLLTEQEYKIFEKELQLFSINLIDFIYVDIRNENNYITIDKDRCII